MYLIFIRLSINYKYNSMNLIYSFMFSNNFNYSNFSINK